MLGMPGLRQVRIFCSVDDVNVGDVIIAGAAEWLDRCMLIERQIVRKKESSHELTCLVPLSTL